MKLWIARMQNGELFLFRQEPKRVDGYFSGLAICELPPFNFPELTFENSPRKVELKLL